MKITDMRRLVAEANDNKHIKKVEEEQLDEVRMSPSVFAKWAASPEAEGIRAGFEAEMIFRDTERGSGDEEYEPDYDSDERAYSIDEIIDFFTSGEGISARAGRQLERELREEYSEWREERIADQWEEEKEEQIRDYMESNVWDDDIERLERIREKLEENGIENVDEVIAVGKDNDKENELYAVYQQAYDSAREDFDEEVTDTIQNDEGDYYDSAREYWQEMMYDSSDYDESDWLNDIGYSYMSDVSNDRSLDWPYWTGGNSGGGSRSWEDIGSDLKSIIPSGHEVRVGGGYHSTARKDNRWIIEPDGSLEPDDDEDAGLEIVSPPMPLSQALESLESVINWGNESYNAYTNSSTGLHMGISLPFKGGDVDYVKLILFMGDKYVLEKFERQGVGYCVSAMEKLKKTQQERQRTGRDSEKTATALTLIQKNLIELAQRYVQDSVGTSKYTSAHIKDGYIEFRSPGGDYLAMADRNEMSEIKNTMLRFAYSMYLAGRPDLERQEYAKKMYKLLGAEKDDALKLFADFSSGQLSKDELKVQWAKQVLSKEVPDIDLEVYDVINDQTLEVVGIIKAKDYSSALEQLRNKYRDRDDWQALDLKKHTGDTDELINKDKLSNRARVAQQINSQPKLYRVSNPNGSNLDIVARSEQEAKELAIQRDETFHRNRSYLTVKLLTTKAQTRDNARDSANIQARIGEPQPAGGTGYYRVTWTERRNGEVRSDALNIDAPNATAAMDRVRSALELQGREPIDIEANAQQRPDRQQHNQNARGGAPRNTFEVYNVNDPERVLDTLRDVTSDEVRAYIQRHEESGEIRPGVLRVRQVTGEPADHITEDLDYILYINNKPMAKYQTEFDANQDLIMLVKKFPNKKFEIKREVCKLTTLRQVGEGKSLLDKPTPTAVEIMRKHGMSEDEFIRQLKLGMKTELEHTNNSRVAMEIALDHINEFPDYYDRLKKVEQ